jgi:hypothetical protein
MLSVQQAPMGVPVVIDHNCLVTSIPARQASKQARNQDRDIDMQAWHAHLFVWIWWLAGSKRKNPCLNFLEKAKQIQRILDHS